MVAEQSEEVEVDGEHKKMVWTPSAVIRRLGKEIDNEESVYYWCYKVNNKLSRMNGFALSSH